MGGPTGGPSSPASIMRFHKHPLSSFYCPFTSDTCLLGTAGRAWRGLGGVDQSTQRFNVGASLRVVPTSAGKPSAGLVSQALKGIKACCAHMAASLSLTHTNFKPKDKMTKAKRRFLVGSASYFQTWGFLLCSGRLLTRLTCRDLIFISFLKSWF